MLLQEIEILRKLRHENVILMLDHFETATEFCVVTEYAQVNLVSLVMHFSPVNWVIQCLPMEELVRGW